MLTDYYLDARYGNDSTGTGGQLSPWKTINQLLTDATGLKSGPITSDVTIHLAGTQNGPDLQYYDYVSLDLTGVHCLPGVTLNWQPCLYPPGPSYSAAPQEWNDGNYYEAGDPFSTTTPPAPLDVLAGMRPCQFSQGILCTGGMNNVFRGICFGAAANWDPLMSMGVTADTVGVHLIYCAVGPLPPAPNSIGIFAVGSAMVNVENSLVANFNTGALAAEGAWLLLSGNNWFADCGAVGVQAWADARVLIQPWYGPGQPTWRTTTIVTTSPRAEYKAVWASASKIMISDLTPIGLRYRGQLQVVKQDLHGNDEYYGVVLEAQSLLLGAKLVMFTNPALATTQPAFETVPAGQQIVLKAGEGCVRVN
jgi:hypothetical protein